MDTVELIGRLIIALGVVLGAIWVIARKVRGGGARQKLRTEKLIDVLGRQNLTKGSSVAVVRVADQALIIGVTDSNVRVLGEVELDAARAHLAAQEPSRRLSAVKATASAPVPNPVADELARRRAAEQAAPLAAASGMDTVMDAPLPAGLTPRPGKLAGSALSPATWKQTIDALREMTARKG